MIVRGLLHLSETVINPRNTSRTTVQGSKKPLAGQIEQKYIYLNKIDSKITTFC